jgi:hypothetical protein
MIVLSISQFFLQLYVSSGVLRHVEEDGKCVKTINIFFQISFVKFFSFLGEYLLLIWS